MKRRVIIITNAGKVGSENYCEGVYRDKENYISFFKSGYGGYYSDSEIRPFDKPSKAKVREELLQLTRDEIEFSIIVFCGHGWYSTISESNIFELNDNKEQIDSLELRANAKKRIIIEDNCREPYSEYITDSLIKSFSAEALFEDYRQRINPEECKRYYNKEISECPEQLIIGQACKIGETAGDSSSTGGYYSSSLLKKTKETAENDLQSVDLTKSYKTYNFPSNHNLAVPIVQKRSGNKQNPQIEKPRYSDSSNYLPFAIIA
ncbi:MAG TPA: hypothetical protein GX005_00405 [Bacteroidales bacterium]|nr:hypothetical protein [Bacteroidales bacterium]